MAVGDAPVDVVVKLMHYELFEAELNQAYYELNRERTL